MADNPALALVQRLTGQSEAVRRFVDVGATLTTGVIPSPAHDGTPRNAATAMLWWGSHGFSVSIHLRPGANAADVVEGQQSPRVVIQEHGDQPAALRWTPYQSAKGEHTLIVENAKDADRTIVTFIDYILSLARFRDDDGHFWSVPR